MTTHSGYETMAELELFRLVAAKDDETAFTVIYRRYAPTLYSLALHYLADEEAAKDAVQHVFVRLWEQCIAACYKLFK